MKEPERMPGAVVTALHDDRPSFRTSLHSLAYQRRVGESGLVGHLAHAPYDRDQ